MAARRKGNAMLIEFRVSNFRSFNEVQTFSLVASKDALLPDNLIQVDGESLLKAAAVYGANASGKSNLVKALGFVKRFVTTSATQMNQGDPIPSLVHFRLDPAARSRPSSFELQVLIDEICYHYAFSATADRVYDERLHVCWPGKRKQRWFDRHFDEKVGASTWAFGASFKKSDQALLRDKTRDNGLLLSRAAELNFQPLVPLFLWFRDTLAVLDLSGSPDGLVHQTALLAKNDENLRQRITQIVSDADMGVDEVSITEKKLVWSLSDHMSLDKFNIVNLDQTLIGGGTIYYPPAAFPYAPLSDLTVQLSHRLPQSSKHVIFDLDDESSGTRRLFALCGPMLEALSKGGVVVVDEIDCSMHPLLVRRLLELFQSASANSRGAQLVFTTQDATMMDNSLFRRDQIWLIEKKPSGASDLFSLYDFSTKGRPRNTEALQRNYLAGRYGGVPRFGPTFEDLEIK